MKAVNQSIGRAIRHQRDYASILLVDYRYNRKTVMEQLPGWIRTRVASPEKFGQLVAQLKNFYKQMQA